MATFITDYNTAPIFLTMSIFCTVLTAGCMISYLGDVIDNIYVIVYRVWILSRSAT